MSNKKLTVGLLWHSISSDNLGVGALTLSQMALITRAAENIGKEVQFITIGTRGETPYPIEEFNILKSAEFALRAFRSMDVSAITLMRHCDVIFDIGEGDSYADIYGIRRLTMQVLSKILAKSITKKLFLSPQTIGPFKSRTGRFVGSIGMLSADRIYTRDHLSSTYVKELGFSHKLEEVIDVAFALPYTKQSNPKNPARIGINVSGLMMHEGAKFGMTLNYEKLIHSCCEYFLSIPEAEVYLVPHVISDAHEVEDDLRASQKLASQYPKLKIAPRFKNPIEAKSFISSLTFFTGARMHACIAAFSSGVPVIPMAYSRKFNGLFSSLGYHHVLDCLSMSTDNGVDLIRASWKKRDELAQEVVEGNVIAQRKIDLYVAGIQSLISTR